MFNYLLIKIQTQNCTLDFYSARWLSQWVTGFCCPLILLFCIYHDMKYEMKLNKLVNRTASANLDLDNWKGILVRCWDFASSPECKSQASNTILAWQTCIGYCHSHESLLNEKGMLLMWQPKNDRIKFKEYLTSNNF